MSIREKGYHKWQGELKKTAVPWLPIFNNGIKTAFKKKYAKALFSMAIGHFLVFLGGIYASTKPELRMFSEIVELLKNDALFFSTFFTNGFIMFALLVLCFFVFADLISGDLRTNSFPLYFSRPLDRKDYVLGKFSIIMFYLLLFTLVPGFLLVIFKFLFAGSFTLAPGVLFGLIMVPLLLSSFLSAITLMISSLSSNSRYVKIILLLFFIFSNSLAEILKGIFKSTYFNLFSVGRNLEQLGAYIFDIRPAFSVPGWMSLAFVLGFILLSFIIIFKKIGKSEAQIEIGS